ncbi:MAG TPA: YhcN/YlaJ family sporulation lipoprotein [Calditerricola sp.]
MKKLLTLAVLAGLTGTLAACQTAAPPNTPPPADTRVGPQATYDRVIPGPAAPDRTAPYANRPFVRDNLLYDRNNWSVAPYGTRPGVWDDRIGPNGTADRTNRQLANRVDAVAERVRGVRNATVLISGDNIVIGIEPTRSFRSRDAVRTVERNVHKNVRAVVPANYEVYVTAKPDLVRRTQDLAGRMASGASARMLINDTADLIRDIGRTVTTPLRGLR